MIFNLKSKNKSLLLSSTLALLLSFTLVSCFEDAEPDGIIGGNGLVPAVISFEPETAEPGQQVTITGRDLQTTNSVTFNGSEAEIISTSANSVVALVPQTATTGVIGVVTDNGQNIFRESFTVFIDGAPIVDEITPSSVQVGNTVTLRGSLMNAVSQITIGGVEATDLAVSPNEVSFVVGEGTPFGATQLEITSSVGISTTDMNETPFFVYEVLEGLNDTFDMEESFIFAASNEEISFAGINTNIIPADPADTSSPFSVPSPIDNNFLYIGGNTDTSDSGSFTGIILSPQQEAGTYADFFNDEASQNVSDIYINMDVNVGEIPDGYLGRVFDIRFRFDSGYDADSDGSTSDELMEYRASISELANLNFVPNENGWYSVSISLIEFLNSGAGGSWDLYQIEDLTRIAITSRREYNGEYSLSIDNVFITKGGPINTK